jgi:hypothetical protein
VQKSENLLRRKWQSLSKLVAMVGGFLLMIGIILLGVAVLALFGYCDASMLLQNKYVLIFALIMAAVGLLDTFSAIIMARW